MNSPYPWQLKQWHLLVKQWQEKNFPHALLLSGPNGLGKSHFAHTLASRLLCEKKYAPDEYACGECQTCLLIASQSHPDLLWIQPEELGKAIKIDTIRELITSLQQTAHQSAYQIVILEPAEAMNKSSANALLKTLEEPHGAVFFLLLSHQPNSIPATIRSRCQRIHFPIPPTSITLPWLAQQLPDDNATLLLALSENIPLRALRIAEKAQLTMREQLLEHFIAFAQFQLTPLEMAACCNEIPEASLFEMLWLILADLIRLQQSPNCIIAHRHHTESLTAIAYQIPTITLFHFLDQFLQLKKMYDEKINLNRLSALEALFIYWLFPHKKLLC